MPLIISKIIYLCITLLVILEIPDAYAAKLLFIDLPDSVSVNETRAKKAAEFYGMEFYRLELGNTGSQKFIADTLRGSKKSLVVINARSLSRLSKDEVVKALVERRKTGNDITLVILGIDTNVKPVDLQAWSSGAIESCQVGQNRASETYMEFADLPDINWMLSRQKAAVSMEAIVSLNIGDAAKQNTVISVRTGEKSPRLPVVVKASLAGVDVFLVSDMNFQHSGGDVKNCDVEILQMLPVLVPVKYGCGEYCWQSPGVYANLTIDDPFLVEPYGFLSFTGLLKEMEKVRFHATIAFIPWNYDRSEKNVADIIRNNPDKYSIAVHGSDHGVREFQDNGVKELDEDKVRKALARMEAFRNATGIDYERTMVFPRSIGSLEAMQVLKKYNFLGTANWNIVPDGMKGDDTSSNCLNDVIFDAEGFPSIRRHRPGSVSAFRLASIMYLGMPVLYSAHHDNFQTGIDGFNKTAELVNSVYPNVQWVSLGNVFRHLYMQKKRDDGSWDVKTYSRSILLSNKQGTAVTYHISKTDDLSIPIKAIKFNGGTVDYAAANRELLFKITIPSRDEREVTIDYEYDLDLGSVDISKDDYKAGIVRWLAEFRDRTLSQSAAGLVLVKLVYDKGETKKYMLFLAALLLGLFGVCIYITKKMNKRH